MAKLPFLLALSQWVKQPFKALGIFLIEPPDLSESYIWKPQKTCTEFAVKKNVFVVPGEL